MVLVPHCYVYELFNTPKIFDQKITFCWIKKPQDPGINSFARDIKWDYCEHLCGKVDCYLPTKEGIHPNMDMGAAISYLSPTFKI